MESASVRRMFLGCMYAETNAPKNMMVLVKISLSRNVFIHGKFVIRLIFFTTRNTYLISSISPSAPFPSPLFVRSLLISHNVNLIATSLTNYKCINLLRWPVCCNISQYMAKQVQIAVSLPPHPLAQIRVKHLTLCPVMSLVPRPLYTLGVCPCLRIYKMKC